MKILVVSGFLGAGKTTFIRSMSKKTSRDFVVYENEYSGVDVDAKLLETDSVAVWESTENCVCCTGKGDFAASLLTIAASLDPEYLVVEPTGMARLSSILSTISQVRYSRIELLPPIVIVDCANFRQQQSAAPEIWRDQAANASVIVLSKSERATQKEKNALKTHLCDINATARILDVPFEQISPKSFLAMLENDDTRNAAVPAAQQGQVPQEAMETFALNEVALPSPAHLFAFLDLAVGGAFGKVARAKGFFYCGTPGEWLRFDLVAREWAVTGMKRGSKPAITVIGTELNRRSLRETLLFGGKTETRYAAIKTSLYADRSG